MVFSVVVGSLGDGVFLVRDFSSSISIRGFGSFVEDVNEVCISVTDGDWVGMMSGRPTGFLRVMVVYFVLLLQ